MLSNFINSDFHDEERPVPFGSLLSHRIFLQCAIGCVKVAQEAIDTIHGRQAARAGDIGCLSAWWYNVLYLYTSATVLIAARLSPSILAEVSEESILDGWHKAVEVLEGYGVFGTSIRRLTNTLRLLFDAVPQQYSRLRQHPRQLEADAAPVTHPQAQGVTPLPYWRPTNPVSSLSSSLHEPAGNFTYENNNPSSTGALPEFDIVFDPNDLSWLMTVPLNG